jgi:hypothetical protein
MKCYELGLSSLYYGFPIDQITILVKNKTLLILYRLRVFGSKNILPTDIFSQQSNLTYKCRAYLSGAYYKTPLKGKAPRQQILDYGGSHRHNSLLRYGINYGRKNSW